jgi:hypothetical protein
LKLLFNLQNAKLNGCENLEVYSILVEDKSVQVCQRSVTAKKSKCVKNLKTAEGVKVTISENKLPPKKKKKL